VAKIKNGRERGSFFYHLIFGYFLSRKSNSQPAAIEPD
jgi:hypothetical protein